MTHRVERCIAWGLILGIIAASGAAAIHWMLVVPGALTAQFIGSAVVCFYLLWIVTALVTWHIAQIAFTSGQPLSELPRSSLQDLRDKAEELLASTPEPTTHEAAERIREARG